MEDVAGASNWSEVFRLQLKPGHRISNPDITFPTFEQLYLTEVDAVAGKGYKLDNLDRLVRQAGIGRGYIMPEGSLQVATRETIKPILEII